MRTAVVSKKWSVCCVTLTAIIFSGQFLLSGAATVTDVEYCQDETFTASCDPGHVLHMTSARYGRLTETQSRRCVQQALYVGCTTDVTKYVNSLCLGRHSCRMSVMDANLRATKPCPVDVTWHLYVTYECLPVTYKTREACTANRVAEVTSQSGYLASVVLEDMKVGGRDCAWRIVAKPGQTISLSAYSYVTSSAADATTAPKSSSLASAGSENICFSVAIIRETGTTTGQRIRVCSSDTQRQMLVYQSTQNSVDVEFMPPSSTFGYLLSYQVVGCATPPIGRAQWLQRSGNQLVIGCNASRQQWQMTCQDGNWLGTLGNCTSQQTAERLNDWSINKVFENQNNFPFGLLITVATGVTLGVFLGGTALFIIARRMNSRHRKDTEQHHIDDDYQHDYVTQSYEAALAHQSQQATDTVKRTKMTATLQRQPHHLCLGARLAGTNEINQNDDVSDFCALQPTDCRGLNVTTEPLLPPAGVGYQSALCTVAHPHFYDAPSCDERPSRQNQSRRVKLQT